MSSYICFHLKRKGVEKKDLFLSYCRSTKIYQCFHDSGIPFYYSNPEPFAEVTENMLNDILSDISSERQTHQDVLKTLYRLSDKSVVQSVLELEDQLRDKWIGEIEGTDDLVGAILWREGEVRELDRVEVQIEFLKDMLDEMKYDKDDCPFEGIYANIV